MGRRSVDPAIPAKRISSYGLECSTFGIVAGWGTARFGMPNVETCDARRGRRRRGAIARIDADASGRSGRESAEGDAAVGRREHGEWRSIDCS